MQEIENHFSSKRELPKSLRRKEPVSDEPFPKKFDITHWESNEKFEQHLKNHRMNALEIKSKVDSSGKNPTNRSRAVVNDDDYDTPL